MKKFLLLYEFRRVIAVLLVAAPDQDFALRHSCIIHATLASQGNRYRVAFGIRWIPLLHVVGIDRDSNLLAFVGIDNG